MGKEIERAGIPVAYFTALPNLAQTVGAPRIISGKAILFPVGDPALPPEGEKAYRRTLVETGLRALGTEVNRPTVFTV